MGKQDSGFKFRVSDAVPVPLRGTMLRLRLLEGAPSVKDLAVGRRLRLTSPTGETREITIKAHSVTAGRQTQARLDKTREFDVIMEAEGKPDAPAIDIGWMASGPIEPSK